MPASGAERERRGGARVRGRSEDEGGRTTAMGRSKLAGGGRS